MSNTRTVFDLVKIKISGGIHSMLSFMRGREKRGEGFSIGTALIVSIIIIAFLLIMAFSFGVAMVLGFQMHMKKCLWLFFPLGFISSTVFSLIGTVFAAQSYLFDSKDNDLLLSMPIQPSAILLSRILALYTLNFVYSTIIFLPIGVAYGIFFKFTFVTFLCFLISIFLIPMLSTAISCLFGYFTGKITVKIPNKNLLSVVFGFVMLGGLSAVGLNLGPIISMMMYKIEVIADSVQKYSHLLYWYGLASQQGKFWGLLPMLIFSLGFSYLIFIFISRKFIKMITRKVAMKKKKYVEKPMKPTNLFHALVSKELGYFFSIPAYVMNSGMSTIMSIILGVGILLRGDLIVNSLPQLFPDASGNLVALMIGSSLALCCTMNDVTAPTISLEGKTLWLLKSTPIDPMKIFFAKALMAPIVSLPGVIFTVIASAVTLDLTVADVLFIFFIPIIACVFSGFLGICVNLKIPRFDWSTEITIIKQSLSVVITLFLAMFFTSIPFVVAIVPAAYLEDFSALWSYGICIIYFVFLVILEIFYLYTDGKTLWRFLNT